MINRLEMNILSTYAANLYFRESRSRRGFLFAFCITRDVIHLPDDEGWENLF